MIRDHARRVLAGIEPRLRAVSTPGQRIDTEDLVRKMAGMLRSGETEDRVRTIVERWISRERDERVHAAETEACKIEAFVNDEIQGLKAVLPREYDVDRSRVEDRVLELLCVHSHGVARREFMLQRRVADFTTGLEDWATKRAPGFLQPSDLECVKPALHPSGEALLRAAVYAICKRGTDFDAARRSLRAAIEKLAASRRKEILAAVESGWLRQNALRNRTFDRRAVAILTDELIQRGLSAENVTEAALREMNAKPQIYTERVPIGWKMARVWESNRFPDGAQAPGGYYTLRLVPVYDPDPE